MQNPLDLTGRTFVVTGATSGLGLPICRMLAGLGSRVVLMARDEAKLAAAVAGLPEGGHIAESLDLTDYDQIPGKLGQLAQKHGPFNGVVHCAGIMTARPLRMLGGNDWDTAMRINVSAAAALTKGFRQRGVHAGGGSVVLLASVTGLVGQSAQSLYGATKGALIALARALAVELAAEKIRVNCVAPAVVNTGMSETIKASVSEERWAQIVAQHPLGIGSPEDVAHAVAFLLGDTGRWITGTTLVVDGGFTAQ